MALAEAKGAHDSRKPRCTLHQASTLYQGYNSSHVGQITRHLATRLQEHWRASSHVYASFELWANHDNARGEVLNRRNLLFKLLTLEALHISRRKPGIDQEYRSRELTQRMKRLSLYYDFAVKIAKRH